MPSLVLEQAAERRMPEKPVSRRPAVFDLGEALGPNPYDAEPYDLAGHGQRRLLDPKRLKPRQDLTGARLREPGPDPAGIDELITFQPGQHQGPEAAERAGGWDVARDHERLAM